MPNECIRDLLSELRRMAERSSMDEILARIATRRGGHVGFDVAVQDLKAERPAHD